MSLHLVSTMDTFYYSLLLFNLCTALGETSARLSAAKNSSAVENLRRISGNRTKNSSLGFTLK